MSNLTVYESTQRREWALPCFRNDDYIILSDSQFRRINNRDLERIWGFNIFIFSSIFQLKFKNFRIIFPLSIPNSIDHSNFNDSFQLQWFFPTSMILSSFNDSFQLQWFFPASMIRCKLSNFILSNFISNFPTSRFFQLPSNSNLMYP